MERLAEAAKMKIAVIAGARPNFVKIAPLMKAMAVVPAITPILIHTGQHYDRSMSDQFFADLDIPPADFSLGVGSGSHAVQTGEVMQRLEPVLQRVTPDLVIVVGDVNSTVAAALTAVKLGIRVAHVEAGLRSFDRSMPEEINRLVTDAISDLLFVSEESGCANLLREGVPGDKSHLVGNVMIDALEASRPRWSRSRIRERAGLAPGTPYAVLTLHRPSNVDDPAMLETLVRALNTVAKRLPILFPVHPRVRRLLSDRTAVTWCALDEPSELPNSGIFCLDPLGYLDFVALTSGARLVLTDSGGVQEETTILRVPCLTLRHNTERPATVTHGTNRIIGTDPAVIVHAALKTLENPPATAVVPRLWDGRAAARIVDIVLREVSQRIPGEGIVEARA
jgi:UDP-N-acetylglucosamine 2-epimerase (non-hydrolysing)